MSGGIAGSFLATLVLRWPAGRSISQGRSRCDGCGETLGAAELVPILSYILLRGRCRRCGAGIDARHIAIEAAGALIGAAALGVAPGLAGISGALFGWLLLALGALDLEHYWLPDALTLPLGTLGLAAGLWLPPPMPDRLIGAAAGYAALALVGLGYSLLRGRVGLGGGDAKLLAAIGAWLGWTWLPTVVLAAAAGGLGLVGMRRILNLPVSRHDRLPLGSLLAVAAWLCWLAMARSLDF